MMNHVDALIAFAVVLLFASLLVTVITQIVAAIFNLRGRNLLWGLTRLLNEIEPEYEDAVKEVVKKVLKYPLITKSKWRLANVIRVEEFEQLLVKFAKNPEKFELSARAKELVKKFDEIDTRALKEQLQGLPDNLEEKAQENLTKAYLTIQQALHKSRNKIISIETWFDNMTDRMSERFTLRSKVISVAAAFVVAVSLQLDSINLIQSIYADDDLRARLIASTEKVLSQGEQILSQKTTYDIAMDSLNTRYPEVDLSSTLSFKNRPGAKRWLAQHAPADVNTQTLIEEYNDIHDSIIRDQFHSLGQEALALREQIDQLGLKLITKDYHWAVLDWKLRKVLGVLISVVLLSLGAPFWFNALKNLVNLRSKVMRSEEQERQHRKQETISE